MSANLPKPAYPAGHYYIVDIKPIVAEYMQSPSAVRMVNLGDTEFTANDVLDIELSDIVPLLSHQGAYKDVVRDHIQSLLDDGQDIIEDQMSRQGIPTEGVVIRNTLEQCQHSELVDTMADQLVEVFKAHKLYQPNGELVGEHCTVTEDGLLILRRPTD